MLFFQFMVKSEDTDDLNNFLTALSEEPGNLLGYICVEHGESVLTLVRCKSYYEFIGELDAFFGSDAYNRRSVDNLNEWVEYVARLDENHIIFKDGADFVSISEKADTLHFQFEASSEGNVLWAENNQVSVKAVLEVPEGASEDYGYITLKNAILAALTDDEKAVASFWYDGQEQSLADDATAGEAEVEIQREEDDEPEEEDERERFIAILMADRYSRQEAKSRLHDGTTIYDSIEEWIQSLKDSGCYSGETVEGARAGKYQDISVVTHEGHEYLIEKVN